MSRFEVDWSDDGMTKLLATSFDEIAQAALKEAAPVLEQATKEACQSVIAHSGDSELVNSWKKNEPKKTKDGDAYIVNVTPKGQSKNQYYAQDGKGGHRSRKYPVTNALKAIWLENGTYRQPAKHFLEKAAKNAEAEVNKRIEKVFHEKVGAT